MTLQPTVFDFEAMLFDLDGVLTSTGALHEAAWKSMFDEFLRHLAEQSGEPFVAFERDDYLRYVDGKPRFDGVESFVDSRGIRLPRGEVDAAPSMNSIAGLGNRKNQLFNDLLESHGVEPLPGAVDLLEAASEHRLRTAVVSSSANAGKVIDAAGLGGRFDTVVDGLVARRLGLAGKPAPDTFLEAARQLEVGPGRAIVLEDAEAGVAAGKAGGFALVVGVGAPDREPSLRSHGADLVVETLHDLIPD